MTKLSYSSESIYTSLSPAQKIVSLKSVNSRLLVLAGPGTGKTHTMIRRLAYLILEEGIQSHNEILVLSFSRAAVAEIKQRLVNLVKEIKADDLRFINVRTFDSLATRMLIAVDEESELNTLDYDARIDLAVRRLSDPDSEIAQLISHYRHLVVDEIQDLVGVRARFVFRLLQLSNNGFTLLGDPAQGIYDYLVRKENDGPTSQEFLSQVRNTWKQDLIEHTLSTNHRVTSDSADVASQTREIIMAGNKSDLAAYRSMKKIVSDLPQIGTVFSPSIEVFDNNQERNAVLCRTNSDVLFAYHALRQNGLSVVIPPTLEERGLPAWVAQVFMDWTIPQISHDEFLIQWARRIGEHIEIQPNQAWRLIKRNRRQ